MTRREFFGILAAIPFFGRIFSASEGRVWPCSTVQTAGGVSVGQWPIYTCAEHDYADVPSNCPVWNCKNGTTRMTWVGYRMAGFAEGRSGDEISFGEERIFLRAWDRTPDKKRRFYWLELTGNGRKNPRTAAVLL